MVVVFGSQKGGVGKTTLGVALGERLIEQKHKVFWLDRDSQQSLSKWVYMYRGKDYFVSLINSKKSVSDSVKGFIGNSTSHVIIDVSGRDSAQLRESLLVADIWFVPYAPSQIDINTRPQMDKVYEEINMVKNKVNPNPLQRFNVMNRMPTDSRRNSTLTNMSRLLGTEIAVFERVFFRRLFEGSLNWNVDPKARDEIDLIVKTIFFKEKKQ